MKTPRKQLQGKRRVVVLGGAGAMGRITVKDLFETAPPDFEILIADYNVAAGRSLARSYRRERVQAAAADVTNVHATARLLSGAFAVINAVKYQHNIKVMRAALDAGAHYLDLGGLFHVTREQLKLDRDFKRQGLLALLGMGAAPGIVNLLAASAADTMERVHEIHIQVAGLDAAFQVPEVQTSERTRRPLATSYSLETVLDESTLPAAVYRQGRFRFVPPMSGEIEVHFPAPVGLRRPVYTLHSEVATLPLSYKHKGIKEVSFRIAFDEDLDEELRFLHALGISSTTPLKLGKAFVVPRDFLLALLKRMKPPPPAPLPETSYEVLRAVVRGEREKRPVQEVVDCHVSGLPAWGMGIDIDTGCPPSIAVQLLARGELSARGVLPPERAVPPEPFFRELATRGMTVLRQTTPLHEQSVGNAT
jgi:saccharopine dehydrogenase-like NADP-dependent oxidoreductase